MERHVISLERDVGKLEHHVVSNVSLPDDVSKGLAKGRSVWTRKTADTGKYGQMTIRACMGKNINT